MHFFLEGFLFALNDSISALFHTENSCFVAFVVMTYFFLCVVDCLLNQINCIKFIQNLELDLFKWNQLDLFDWMVNHVPWNPWSMSKEITAHSPSSMKIKVLSSLCCVCPVCEIIGETHGWFQATVSFCVILLSFFLLI